MKKLMILMLVLGLASTANAVLVPGMSLMVAEGTDPCVAPAQGDYYDPVDTELVLYPSDYLWIGVHNSIAGEPGAPQKGDFYLFFDATIPPVDGEWTGAWTTYEPPLAGPVPDNEYWGLIDYYDDGTLIADMWYLQLADGQPDTYNGIGVLDAKEFHCTGPESDVVVYIADENGEIFDSILIHQLPEPMTITLLGLGGLFLRLRKRQQTA